MLRIRQEQTRPFAEQSAARFLRTAIAHLRQKLPERVQSRTDVELEEWAKDVEQRMAGFGLGTEKQIMCVLDAEVLLGPRFYERPEHYWAMDALTGNKLGPSDKAALILATACSFHGNVPS